MRDFEATNYMYGLCVMIVGLAVYSYYVRELLASLVLFTFAFFVLGLAALGVFLMWCAGVVLAKSTPGASRNLIAFSRRLLIQYVKP